MVTVSSPGRSTFTYNNLERERGQVVHTHVHQLTVQGIAPMAAVAKRDDPARLGHADQWVGLSSSVYCSRVITVLNCVAFVLRSRDRRTDRRTDGSTGRNKHTVSLSTEVKTFFILGHVFYVVKVFVTWTF